MFPIRDASPARLAHSGKTVGVVHMCICHFDTNAARFVKCRRTGNGVLYCYLVNCRRGQSEPQAPGHLWHNVSGPPKKTLFTYFYCFFWQESAAPCVI